MSLSTRNYSKESHYSRSASYQANTNNSSNSSFTHRSLLDDRPLSIRLVERDSSCPSLAWNWDWNDPLFRWRFDKDFWKWNFGLGRPIPIYYRSWNNSTSSRIIPIQYSPSSSAINRRQPLRKKTNNHDESSSNLINRHNESSLRRENRLSSDDWPPIDGPPTRKRTSMTIFLRHPYIDQCDVPYYRQTLPTPTYPQSARLDYY